MPRFQFDVPNVCAGALMDELNADGIQPQHLESRDNVVWITVPAMLEPQVSSIVSAHDGPAALAEIAWQAVRGTRNAKLAECDWTDLPNSPVGNGSAWATYRQALRDVPQDFGSADAVTWPTKPA
jgi:hypothetical protein